MATSTSSTTTGARKRSATTLVAAAAPKSIGAYRKCKCDHWVDSRGDAASLCMWCCGKMQGISECDNCGKTHLEAEMKLCQFDPRAEFFWVYCARCFQHVLDKDAPEKLACCGMHPLRIQCSTYNTMIPGAGAGSNARREHNMARSAADTPAKVEEVEAKVCVDAVVVNGE